MDNKYCNCLTFCITKKIKYGGKIVWKKSRTWYGFHTTWIDSSGVEWEYTLQKLKKHPWWYVPVCYQGQVKKVKRRKP